MLTLCFSCLIFPLSSSNSRLRVIAELRHGDLFHAANIISRLVKMVSFYEISFKLPSLVQKKKFPVSVFCETPSIALAICFLYVCMSVLVCIYSFKDSESKMIT